jgi:hypothetical protein
MRRLALTAVLTAPLWPSTAHARPETPPNVHEGKGRIRVWHDPRLRVIGPYRGWLARVRACESGGRYNINTGNGFLGAYQFTVSSWRPPPHLLHRMLHQGHPRPPRLLTRQSGLPLPPVPQERPRRPATREKVAVKRIMDMTQGEIEAAGVRDHERRLAEYEREQDRLAAEQERDEPTVGDLQAYARLRRDLLNLPDEAA